MRETTFTKSAFSQHLADHKIMGTECTNCGTQFLPPRPMCTNCYSGEMRWVELDQHGTLAAFTTVHITSTAMTEAGYGRDNPHCSGIVQLDNGLSISAQVLGVDTSNPASIQIGSSVEAVFLERGDGEQKETILAFQLVS